MKIDKEFLLKHHFWILAVLVLPLELFAFIWLSTSVADDNAKEKKKIDDADKKLKAITQDKVRNQLWLSALNVKDRRLSREKKNVWEKAWDAQEVIFTWPELKDNRHVPLVKATFGDPIDSETCSVFEQAYSDYVTRTYEKDVSVAPTQFPNDSWRNLVQYVAEWKEHPPDAEDVWLCMEDLWVQRELLRIIKNTNELAAKYKAVKLPQDLKLPQGASGAKSFENRSWRLDLWLVQGKLQGRITNVARRRQPLNVTFYLKTHEGVSRLYELNINYRSRAVGESFTFPEQDIRSYNPVGIFEVTQKLDARSVPVKRVEDLKIGSPPGGSALSDRTSHLTLKPRPASAPAEGGTTGAPSGPADSTASAEPTSRNGLVRARYTTVTPQVRRMPVAMVVLVEQDYMQDLLREFANSKLRLQTTQMHWQHVEENAKQAVTGGGMPGVPGVPGLPNRPGAAAESADEEEAALVELAVYGIASIYERPKTDETAEQQPPAPGQPIAPAQPAAPATPPAGKPNS